MAANLEYIGGKAAMFYAKDTGVPWHGEGEAVSTAVSSKEALTLAQLDWEVELQKIYLADGTLIQGRRATVRKLDNKALGIVTRTYEPIQNAQTFEFLDSLFADGQILYDTAGALDGGKTVWMLARMTEDMRIGDDVYGQFLLASTTHDGTRALAVYATSVRVVCENTLFMAIGGPRGVNPPLVRVRHSGDIDAKLEKARSLLTITNEQHRRFETWLNELNDTEINEEFVNAVTDELFGGLDEATPTVRRNAIEAFREIYGAERDAVGETAYALVNAVTGYADHRTRVTINNTRMGSAMKGQAADFKSRGIAAISKRTGKVLSKV